MSTYDPVNVPGGMKGSFDWIMDHAQKEARSLNQRQKNILSKTQSICPICQKPTEAFYVERGGKVFFEQHCEEHGVCRTTVSETVDDYRDWVAQPVINVPPKAPITKGDAADQGCPLHCGTCENHLQTACCVLIDVTNRCNQHCPYCFADAKEHARRDNEPTLAEIEAKYDLLLELGEERTFNIQLSGGEPTVRDDLPEIIRMAKDKGFAYVQINSNGRRIACEKGYAQKLKAAGASVVFMQFDGTNDAIYRKLRNEPLLAIKKQAIRNCEAAGLPVTLVPTIVKGVNTENIGEMMDFLLENVNVVKGIHFQPVSFFGRHPETMETPKTTGTAETMEAAEVKALEKAAGNAQAENRQSDNPAPGTVPSKTPGNAQGENGRTRCLAESNESQPEPVQNSGDFPGRITMFGLLRELEKQRPAFQYEDFCPIATGHALCCFYSTYIREPDGSARCTMTKARKESGISCCDASMIDKGEVIRKDRDFVLNKWEIAPPQEAMEANENPKYKSSAEITSLDEFLRYYSRNAFTVTGMAFQDITNLDAERVKRCRVQVLSEDHRLIPFCAYNSIYRSNGKNEKDGT